MYATLVLGIAQLQIWSITPALAGASGATRGAVGNPEAIPDVTFLAREITASDGDFSATEITHFNGYTAGARGFHKSYGLDPTNLDAFEQIFDHPKLGSGKIGRIRLICHGTGDPEGALLFAAFRGGSFRMGTPKSLLDAMANSDEQIVRFLISGKATETPLFNDITPQLIEGIRNSSSSNVLQPLGLKPAASSPSAELRAYIEVVGDFYQTQFGTLVLATSATTNGVPTPANRTSLTNSLNIVEAEVRSRLDGKTFGGVTLHSADLLAFKTAVLGFDPAALGFTGKVRVLPPSVVADVQAALADSQGSPGARISAIQTAIGGASPSPMFGDDYLDGILFTFEKIKPSILKIGTTQFDKDTVRGNAKLEAFALAALDLHYLKNAPVRIGTSASSVVASTADKAVLRQGVVEICNQIRSQTPLPATKLNALRDAIENLPWTESAITGGLTTHTKGIFAQLDSANTSLQGGFRTRLKAFQARIKPNNESAFDIRGCLVGSDPDFLDSARKLLGTSANMPVVSAPDHWQSFPIGSSAPGGVTMATIDSQRTSGISALNITGADVVSSFDTARPLIDFDPHFDFVTALFATGTSFVDFASLAWRAWKTTTNPMGIPMLRMEAVRIDDIATKKLGELIERFALIFAIPTGSVPNAAARTKLDLLQPHVATFKTIEATVAAASSPNATQIGQFYSSLSGLAANIASVGGFASPPAPLAPPNASPTLADVQGAVTRTRSHLEAILKSALNGFFTAVRGATGNANAPLRYYYNIGLPLLLKSTTHPTHFTLSVMVTNLTPDLFRSALRSWMRIQWEGSATQATTVNAAISAATNITEMSRVSMLTDEDPIPGPGDPPVRECGIAPMPDYHSHIVTKP